MANAQTVTTGKSFRTPLLPYNLYGTSDFSAIFIGRTGGKEKPKFERRKSQAGECMKIPQGTENVTRVTGAGLSRIVRISEMLGLVMYMLKDSSCPNSTEFPTTTT